MEKDVRNLNHFFPFRLLFLASVNYMLCSKLMFWHYTSLQAIHLLTWGVEGEILYLLSAKSRALTFTPIFPNIFFLIMMPHDTTDNKADIILAQSLNTGCHVKVQYKLSQRKIFLL